MKPALKLTEQLVAVGRAYAASQRLSLARVSTLVLNRGATLEKIETGEVDVNTRTFEKALQWFSDRWPAEAEWPEDVPRPAPRPVADRESAEPPEAELPETDSAEAAA